MDRNKLLQENERLMVIRDQQKRMQAQDGKSEALEVVKKKIKHPSSIIDLYNQEITDYTPPSPETVQSREKWDRFDWQWHPKVTAAKYKIVDWWNNEMRYGGGLILAGNNGCGKTQIARALCEWFGPGAALLNELDMTVKIKNAYDGDGSEYTVLNPYKSAKLLVIDDLGADENCKTSWIQNFYTYLLNDRARYNQPTIVTTNLCLQFIYKTVDGKKVKDRQIENRLGSRAFDRLKEQVKTTDNYISLFGVPSYRAKDWVE